jgi:hypothetical protein
MTSSPTQRTLANLRGRGYHCEIVEKWNQWSRQRHDLFNMFDILALAPDGTLVGVQTTTTNHAAERVKKLRANPLLEVWCKKNVALVQGWAKRGPRGKRKLWTLWEVDLGASTEVSIETEDDADGEEEDDDVLAAGDPDPVPGDSRE